jgi:hypothetical protein
MRYVISDKPELSKYIFTIDDNLDIEDIFGFQHFRFISDIEHYIHKHKIKGKFKKIRRFFSDDHRTKINWSDLLYEIEKNETYRNDKFALNVRLVSQLNKYTCIPGDTIPSSVLRQLHNHLDRLLRNKKNPVEVLVTYKNPNKLSKTFKCGILENVEIREVYVNEPRYEIGICTKYHHYYIPVKNLYNINYFPSLNEINTICEKIYKNNIKGVI